MCLCAEHIQLTAVHSFISLSLYETALVFATANDINLNRCHICATVYVFAFPFPFFHSRFRAHSQSLPHSLPVRFVCARGERERRLHYHKRYKMASPIKKIYDLNNGKLSCTEAND